MTWRKFRTSLPGKTGVHKKQGQRLRPDFHPLILDDRAMRTPNSRSLRTSPLKWCGNPPVRRTTSRGRIPENGTKTTVCITISCLEFDGDSQVSSALLSRNDNVVRCPVFPLQIPICRLNGLTRSVSYFLPRASRYPATSKGFSFSSFLRYKGWWGWPFLLMAPAQYHRAPYSFPTARKSRTHSGR